MQCYLPRKYRAPLLFKGLLVFELALTIALLALTGIAAPNLYRDKLWQDGADNGFNSSPDEMIYTLANYKPYEVPRVWSQFQTNFNLVIAVLSMFFLLTKAPMFLLGVFYPPFSVVVHTSLVVLYPLAISFQLGKDMSDPQHPQPGPPWYITKNCNVASRPSNIAYCQQAKSLFAITVVALAVFVVHLGLAIVSCFPTDEIREKQRRRLERRKTLDELKDLRSPVFPLSPTSPTGNGFPPMTPRTQAFNTLGGTTDLPLRNHYGSQPPASTNSTPQPDQDIKLEITSSVSPAPPAPQPQMYFPPPPKKATK
ncbi:hypothetical protein AJ80_01035 [Polytolypa hystricis UAMH7299]|uniref:Uncharacterized protein n=1 Tax=Polytolypa hystricis (strain UAMH7299) TaxID=1447883 RepID=A0A2B7Z147_POLH7|nr:hypothetical protein AJ80_01035 [Polytolypa hystricis UAMH7299]